MKQVDFLKTYQKDAERYVSEGRVRDIEFSGGTYQVQVVPEEDEPEDVWAFFQLDAEGAAKDYFCSCSSSDEDDHCAHLAAAYLAVFRGNDEPLHIRFKESFWHQLFLGFAEGREEMLPVFGKGLYQLKDEDLRLVFSAKTDDRKRLVPLFEERPEQTEETSLKFSNLDEDEIELWSRGHPSRQFRYELSAWSDLAKMLMLRQDQGQDYSIAFNGSASALPEEAVILFPGLEVRCCMTDEHWPAIVPSLMTVESPLRVYTSEEEGIEKITYDPKRKELEVHAKAPKDISPSHEGIHVGHWSFVPGDGFYAQEMHELLEEPIMGRHQIGPCFEEHEELLRQFMVGTRVNDERLKFHVDLAFDSSWELHVDSYRETPGDLDKPRNQHFGSWVYIDGEGFYRVAEGEVDAFHAVIAPDDLPEFIVRRRALFNRTPGFKLHLASKDTYLDYRLSDDGMLHFENRLEIDDEDEESYDFGPWLYIKDQGFYSKTAKHGINIDTHGEGLPPRDIPTFIRRHREDLRQVKGFFSDQCPISKCSLLVTVADGEELLIEPQYKVKGGYDRARLHFFEDFVFVPGEGFSQIPANIRLPDGYFAIKRVPAATLEPFLEEEVEKIQRFLAPGSVNLEFAHAIKADVIATEEVIGQGRSLVAMKLKYITEHGEIRAVDIWSAIERGQSYYFSDAGVVKLQQTRFDYLRDIGEEQVDLTHNCLHVSTLELIRLDAFEELHPPSEEEQVWHPLLANIFDFDPAEKPPTRGLKSKLRSYQEVGLGWLWQLYRYQLSAMLCDDMGLGKTHQSMALLTAVRNFRKKEKPQFLVVCPTSVIYHWEDKLQQFLPTFKVHTYYGPQRSLKKVRKHYDILLTSYGVLRRDKEELKDIPFEVAIFDEIQIAKNHLSAVHAALLRLEVKMRVGLTGTPIENRIRELKALFDIVLPGYMPSESRYRDLFIIPIEKDYDEGRQKLLSRLIQPFVMRRRKEDVLDDLPEKMEEVAHCELVEDQRQLYKEAISGARTSLLKDLADQDKNISYTHIFALLTALKQICDHPAVYLKDAQGYKNYHSGKWALFTELLQEARGSKQKVVVFSQYLGMMDIIESYLHENGIGFAGIRGATKDRAAQLKRFNEDPDCEVFVASLQAAGLGIDLTAASVVILYDRWWNAAREKQAIDRVHRIGQRRGVQVFKLISKNTFEERIDEIIRHKGRLMDDVVAVDGDNFLKLLDRDDLLELLRDVDEMDS